MCGTKNYDFYMTFLFEILNFIAANVQLEFFLMHFQRFSFLENISIFVLISCLERLFFDEYFLKVIIFEILQNVMGFLTDLI